MVVNLCDQVSPACQDDLLSNQDRPQKCLEACWALKAPEHVASSTQEQRTSSNPSVPKRRWSAQQVMTYLVDGVE